MALLLVSWTFLSLFTLATLLKETNAAAKFDESACFWEGSAPFCDATCPRGFIPYRKDKRGPGYPCWTGIKALCCEASIFNITVSSNVQPNTKPHHHGRRPQNLRRGSGNRAGKTMSDSAESETRRRRRDTFDQIASGGHLFKGLPHLNKTLHHQHSHQHLTGKLRQVLRRRHESLNGHLSDVGSRNQTGLFRGLLTRTLV